MNCYPMAALERTMKIQEVIWNRIVHSSKRDTHPASRGNALTDSSGRMLRRFLPQTHRTFTARAASRTTIVSEIRACSMVPAFAQRDSTAVSVGEKAVLVLNARKR